MDQDGRLVFARSLPACQRKWRSSLHGPASHSASGSATQAGPLRIRSWAWDWSRKSPSCTMPSGSSNERSPLNEAFVDFDHQVHIGLTNVTSTVHRIAAQASTMSPVSRPPGLRHDRRLPIVNTPPGVDQPTEPSRRRLATSSSPRRSARDLGDLPSTHTVSNRRRATLGSSAADSRMVADGSLRDKHEGSMTMRLDIFDSAHTVGERDRNFDDSTAAPAPDRPSQPGSRSHRLAPWKSMLVNASSIRPVSTGCVFDVDTEPQPHGVDCDNARRYQDQSGSIRRGCTGFRAQSRTIGHS